KVLQLDPSKKRPVVGSFLKGGFFENGKSKPTTGEGYGWLEFMARTRGDKSRAKFYLMRREQLLKEIAYEYEQVLLYDPSRQPEIATQYLELATQATGVKRKLAKDYLQRSKNLGQKAAARERAKALGVRLSWF